MARKTTTVTIDGKGRDAGKHFLLTEMSASAAERWAARALLALVRSGVKIPDEAVEMGLAGIAQIGVDLLSGLSWELAEPLLDEMFACIQIIPDPAKPHVVRGLVEDDIEEVATRLRLRREVLNLHIDFFTDAGLLNQARAAVAAAQRSAS